MRTLQAARRVALTHMVLKERWCAASRAGRPAPPGQGSAQCPVGGRVPTLSHRLGRTPARRPGALSTALPPCTTRSQGLETTGDSQPARPGTGGPDAGSAHSPGDLTRFSTLRAPAGCGIGTPHTRQGLGRAGRVWCVRSPAHGPAAPSLAICFGFRPCWCPRLGLFGQSPKY